MAVDYVKEGRVAIFTINRPEAMNALSVEVGRELHQAMSDFRDDPELWVGIVTGAGEKAFCGGADIKDTLPFMQAHSQDRVAVLPHNILAMSSGPSVSAYTSGTDPSDRPRTHGD